MYLVDFGIGLGRTMTAYKRTFFEADYMGYSFAPRTGAAEIIHERMSPHSLSMQAADYITLPERIDSNVVIILPPAVKKQYDSFEREFLLALDDYEVEAVNAAALANKLLQICNGTIYTDDKGSWAELHSAKLDTLADIIDDNPSENILVGYNYKADLERLLKRFPQAQVLDKNPDTIARWNAGEIPLLLAHPASAGHGLNLQNGGALMVWFGLNWSLELYQQFVARLHRQGQTRPCRVVHLVAEGCLDERVMAAIAGKAKTQNELITAIKKRH
jgi:SNF2 family DNA or RNA helicase